MPAGVPLGGIYAAIRAALIDDPALQGLLAPDARDSSLPAVYFDGAVPQTATRPYLTMGLGTQVPEHRMGTPDRARYGWDCTLQLKAVSEQKGDDQNLSILDAVGAVLFDGMDLKAVGSPGFLSDYGTVWADEWRVLPTLVTSDHAGKLLRETPAILRVQAHD